MIVPGNTGNPRQIVELSAGLALGTMLIYNLLYVKKFRKYFNNWSFLKYWSAFVLLIFIYYGLSFMKLPSNYAHVSARGTVIGLFILVTLIFISNGVINNHLKGATLKTLIGCLLINIILEIFHTYSGNTANIGGIDMGGGYALISLLPLLLYVFRKHYIWTFIVVLTLIVFTGKRGPLLIYLMLFPAIIYNYKIFYQRKKLYTNTLLVSLLLLVCIILFYAYAFENINVAVANIGMRLSNIKESNGAIGSGRNFIWMTLLGYWWNTGALYQWIGSGLYATLNITYAFGIAVKGHIAHSDFIEYLLDFGILGLWMWCMVLFKFYRNIRTYFKGTPYISVLLLFCLIILLGRGLFSGTLRPGVIDLSVSIGYLLGIKQIKDIERSKNQHFNRRAKSRRYQPV